MAVVTFLPSGKTIETEQEITVLQAEQQAGIPQDAPCGGNGKCGKCRVMIEGRECLACRTKVRDGMTVTVLSGITRASILAEGIHSDAVVRPIQEGECHIGVDIGTTTVVAYFLDGKTGEILETQSTLNSQFPYGADVISRIHPAVSGKLEELTGLIRESVWSLVQKLCEDQKKSVSSIGTVAVVGNPAMQQIFLGVSPKNLAAPPFAPYFTAAQEHPLSVYFPVEGPGKLAVPPNIAGYIGSDTLGCVLATGMYRDEKMTLMIDIGTNGEMVLGNRDRMTACSTAAGPALEGGRICCGMRGSDGAIDHVWLENGKAACSVIGNTKAQGICGSGIIDAAAAMLDLGILNKRGRIEKEYSGEGKDRRYSLTERVFLTQEDIREIQMAKGAIAAGIILLAKQLGITLEEIDQVILCGAFGNYMKPESACRIGLIPAELQGKIKAGGNGAGMGSREMALDREKLYLTDRLLKKIEFIELASIPEFQRVYASNMMFHP